MGGVGSGELVDRLNNQRAHMETYKGYNIDAAIGIGKATEAIEDLEAVRRKWNAEVTKRVNKLRHVRTQLKFRLKPDASGQEIECESVTLSPDVVSLLENPLHSL